MKQLTLLMLALLSLSVFVSCDDDDDEMAQEIETIAKIASDNSNLTSLVAALEVADLTSVLDGSTFYTVFAPTNEAFDAFLSDAGFSSLNDVPQDVVTDILLNHVIGGVARSTDLQTGYITTLYTAQDNPVQAFVDLSNGVRINGVSNVTNADIEASNGVIHIVDAVIAPPSVVTHALSNPEFSTLVAALTRSDLTIDFVSVLSGEGPFTVFAPTNAAFGDLLNELGASSLDDIDRETLEAVLQYHVIAEANVRSNMLENGMNVTTLQGSDINVEVSGVAKLIDQNNRESEIIFVDVQASNGVVHVIDKVILP